MWIKNGKWSFGSLKSGMPVSLFRVLNLSPGPKKPKGQCVPIAVCQVSIWFSSHGWKRSSSYGDADGWKWSPLVNKCRQMFTDEPFNLANHTLPGSKRIPGGMSKRCIAPLMANFKLEGFSFPWLYHHRSEGHGPKTKHFLSWRPWMDMLLWWLFVETICISL